MDYSEVLSRLIIFLGAGMSIRTAWDRIAEDYKMAVKEGRRGLRYVYEEMYVTSSQLKAGSQKHVLCGIWKQMRAAAVQEVFRAFRAESKKRL